MLNNLNNNASNLNSNPSKKYLLEIFIYIYKS